MTTLRAAAQQALEALQIGYDSAQVEAAQYHAAMAGYRPERHAAMDADVQKIAKAITALRAALAQEEQEPFGYIWPTGRHPEFRYIQQMRDGVAGMPLYAAPPRREWKSLTEKEIDGTIQEEVNVTGGATLSKICRAVEQALKEKNA